MSSFDGQQEGERVLYTITPHVIHQYLAYARLIFLSVFFFVVLWVIGGIVPTLTMALRLTGFLLSIVLLVFGFWWNLEVFKKARTYITDRRIIRFDVVSPFFTTKRALFWNEALKTKAYAPNILFRSMKIGTIDVEPQLAEHEDVRITDVYYYEDLANYIDKILFTFKNKPTDIALMKPFVAKPKGQRYNETTSH
jgi:small-conductance mechanosensitive channel